MIEIGSIVLANSKKELVPQIIKFVTRSNWSHSLFIIPACCDKEMGIEAASNGISCVPFKKSYRQDINQGFRVYKLKLQEDIKKKAIATCLDDLESCYGYLDLPWFIWRALNKLFGKDIKKQNNWVNKNLICSQFCVKYLTECGLGDLFIDYGNNSICCQDLQEIMDSRLDLFEVIEEKI